jgi:DNA polymerase III subunit gamma/tau
MHKALYRSYRPQTFEDVVGQEHIIKTLKNQIQTNTIGHAYLFCGTRGTGKTSTAKIFARTVNCPNSINEEPCNSCDICKEILADNTMDVIEIDAASNNSVDDIREIRENVKYTPTKAKYKVYIIDEVHMLSQGAFNALLKTLEEPPSYVIFILATTEPHKIPATILSRCQRFDFKRVTVSDMIGRMKVICSDIGIEADDKALNLIARSSQGALRDALSILDQCISFSDNSIQYKDVVELLGTVNIDYLFKIANYIVNEDTKSCLEMLNELVIWGKDIKHFISDLIDHFRNLMVCKVSKELDEIISLPEETLEQLKNQSNQIDIKDIIRILNILSEAQDNIKYSSNPRVLVEVCIMKLCQPMYDDSNEGLIKRISKLEQVISSGIKITSNPKAEDNEVKYDNTEIKIEDSTEYPIDYEEIKSEDVKQLEKIWPNILEQIKKDKQMPIQALLREAKDFNINGNTLYIIFDDKFSFAKNKLSSYDTLTYIENVISNISHRKFKIKIILNSQASDINFEESEKEEDKDKGLDILENIFPKDLIDIKESLEEK